MKYIFVISLILGISGPAFARAANCEAAGVGLLEKSKPYADFYGESLGSTEILFAYDCAPSSDGRVVACDVAVSKANGEASDTWTVVMNKSCTTLYTATLVGEE